MSRGATQIRNMEKEKRLKRRSREETPKTNSGAVKKTTARITRAVRYNPWKFIILVASLFLFIVYADEIFMKALPFLLDRLDLETLQELLAFLESLDNQTIEGSKISNKSYLLPGGRTASLKSVNLRTERAVLEICSRS